MFITLFCLYFFIGFIISLIITYFHVLIFRGSIIENFKMFLKTLFFWPYIIVYLIHIIIQFIKSIWKI